jgi:hypothetical protein
MSSAAEEDAEVRRNIAVILARQGALEVHSVSWLYWYQSTNTDAAAAGSDEALL